jgi:hypothetical protein
MTPDSALTSGLVLGPAGALRSRADAVDGERLSAESRREVSPVGPPHLLSEDESTEPHIAYAAMAHALRRHDDGGGSSLSGGEAAADRLEDCIESWLTGRLWAQNKVRELVIHDERHTARVDQLATQLALPLLLRKPRPRLTVEQAELLSMAAWLHDWGHEGGAISADLLNTDVDVLVEQAFDVRDMHGVVTQELLRPEYSGRHGLHDGAVAETVGVLCAHHQGWTSFGRAPAMTSGLTPQLRAAGVRPHTLAEDLQLVHDRARRRSAGETAYLLSESEGELLVALLRVADGADVGVHRVSDAGASKVVSLIRAVQVECARARASLLLDLQRGIDVLPALERIASVRQALLAAAAKAPLEDPNTADPGESLLRGVLDALGPRDTHETVAALRAYITFASRQVEFYYPTHRRVADVRFAVEPHGRSDSWEVDVRVRPSRWGEADGGLAAVQALQSDVVKELDRGNLGTVRACLAERGIHFRQVVDYRGRCAATLRQGT